MHHEKMCLLDSCIMDICIMEVRKEVLVTFAWVTRPERPKGAKDEVKRPEGPPTRSRGPEGPLTSSILYTIYIYTIIYYYGINANESNSQQAVLYFTPPGAHPIQSLTHLVPRCYIHFLSTFDTYKGLKWFIARHLPM